MQTKSATLLKFTSSHFRHCIFLIFQEAISTASIYIHISHSSIGLSAIPHFYRPGSRFRRRYTKCAATHRSPHTIFAFLFLTRYSNSVYDLYILQSSWCPFRKTTKAKVKKKSTSDVCVRVFVSSLSKYTTYRRQSFHWLVFISPLHCPKVL